MSSLNKTTQEDSKPDTSAQINWSNTSYHHNSYFWNKLKRKASLFASEITNASTISSIAAVGAIVFGIAYREARLTIDKSAIENATVRQRYYIKYARRQVIPSIVWGSYSAKIVLASLGLSPSLAREFDLTKAADVAAKSKLTRLRNLRSVIAGFMGMAQVITVVCFMISPNGAVL